MVERGYLDLFEGRLSYSDPFQIWWIRCVQCIRRIDMLDEFESVSNLCQNLQWTPRTESGRKVIAQPTWVIETSL